MKQAGKIAGLFYFAAFAACGIYQPFIKQTLRNRQNSGTSSPSFRCRPGSANS
jgi:hypothetical protein